MSYGAAAAEHIAGGDARIDGVSTRFPQRVYGQGQEPDPRFSLANERTFLAWIRTSLALVAGGVALEALVLDMDPTLRLVAALVFIGLGLLAAVQAWVGWMRTESALRVARALPGPAVGTVVAVGMVIGILLIVLGFVLP